MRTFDYVILGGGVAGLCAAKRLLELEQQPLIIEAGTYPAHKVCGEFISPSSIPVLRNWGIHPLPIREIHLHTHSKTLKIPLKIEAGSLSHLTLDAQLAQSIQKQGGTLLIQTKVLSLNPALKEDEFHALALSSGETIHAKHLLIATGRLPNQIKNTAKPLYFGIKGHFSGFDLPSKSTLQMFSFPGAYLGIVPVENGHFNLACLAKAEAVQKFSSGDELMKYLFRSHPLLKKQKEIASPLFDQWMEAFIPQLGTKKNPDWPRTYWIGDAAQTIPPASGNGITLAIASGILSAEYAVKDQWKAFKKEWASRCRTKMKIAQMMHHLFLHPTAGSMAIQFSHYFPSPARRIFEISRA